MAQPQSESAVHENSCQRRCVWLGPASGGLGWLLQRLSACPLPSASRLTVSRYAQIDVDILRSLANEGGLDRILLACNTRLEYPTAAIEFLQRNCPDIPFAVACDSWWDGARRTGLGTMEPLVLPWYRWWDGWVRWLEGRDPELFAPCQQSVAPWVASACAGTADLLYPAVEQRALLADNSPPGRGLIVGNCHRTCEALAWVGQAVGYEITICSWQKFQSRAVSAGQNDSLPWILWDDSCLNTSGPHANQDPAMQHFLDSAPQAFPDSRLIVAVSLPRVDQWQRAPVIGAPELIIKPDSGQGLKRLLWHIRATAAALQPHSHARN